MTPTVIILQRNLLKNFIFLKSSPTNEEGNRGEEMKWSTLVPHITKTFNWRALLPC